MNSCHISPALLLASHPTRIRVAAMGNMTRGPNRSSSRPRKGEETAPTSPDTEKMAEVRATLLLKLSRKANSNTGCMFLAPPSITKLVKVSPRITHP
jgi:hypothetical protein